MLAYCSRSRPVEGKYRRMYPLIRVDKRIPDGSIWQARRAYLLPAVAGWTRVFGPTGTRWSNPLGGWTTEHAGMSLFHQERPFTISCHGPDDAKRFYIDVAHRVRIEPDLVEFVDLFLDVMIDPDRAVSEKDEHQLVALPRDLQAFARRARGMGCARSSTRAIRSSTRHPHTSRSRRMRARSSRRARSSSSRRSPAPRAASIRIAARRARSRWTRGSCRRGR